jgi:aryl-alcohol dehydrogenase-like predicted oxidoreductase
MDRHRTQHAVKSEMPKLGWSSQITDDASRAATLSPMLAGHATAEGTAHYRDRFPRLRDAGHFRRPEHVAAARALWLPSIGLGTYLGEPDETTDREYIAAISTALRSGINLVDTAINYRHQRSERNVGAALKQLIDSGELNRNEALICSKAGYLSFDGNLPPDPRAYFEQEYVEPGILHPGQIAGGMHCMAPAYLANQIERSRRNLGLETIDVFYVHNPESQLAEVPREVFRQRLRDAFAMLEKQVENGTLCYYGVATWSALRLAESSRDYINLAEVAGLAREVSGDQHHFRFVQLPFNLAMPEAYGLDNQGSGKDKMSLLSAASELGIAVVGSGALLQGQLTHGMPESLKRLLGLTTDAECAIQFSRSAPGLTTSLVGMGHKEHVSANLKPALIPPTPAETWKRLFAEP